MNPQRWLLFVGLATGAMAAWASEPCGQAEALTRWDKTQAHLQKLFGATVAAPRFVIHGDVSQLPRAKADVAAYYDPEARVVHAACLDGGQPVFDTAIRHESTHHYLSSAFGRLPRWLDEGLASYLEVEVLEEGPRRAHLNVPRLQEYIALLQRGVAPSLEQLLSGAVPAGRASAYYASYWALVFALLHHENPALQAQRRALLRALLETGKASREGAPTAVNQRLLQGLARETADLSAWERRWRQELWALR